ncbi:DUF6503 family protein [Lewinella cohaerens]|uniref:DUF6503 family protein n=1 Tax=Lewinella cohaerens TaxID=70995 RepID=UPI00035E262B|nr:DUF6503 family protein [Lewinella cohaerens]
MRYLSLFALLLFLTACSSNAEDASSMKAADPVITDTARWVVEQSIVQHGGGELDTSLVHFFFRERVYTAARVGHEFLYERSYVDKEEQDIKDALSSQTFTRTINGEPAELTAKDSSAYANSLNSVMYFAFLPYFLTDPAVQVEYHGVTEAFGRPHHELKVTFGEEGGGEDFEDEYAYWFSTDDFTLNYLAYNFLVNGGGARFREAYNSRRIEGVIFQDYINYKPLDEARRDVLAFDELFAAGQMDTLSRIELEEVEVE